MAVEPKKVDPTAMINRSMERRGLAQPAPEGDAAATAAAAVEAATEEAAGKAADAVTEAAAAVAAQGDGEAGKQPPIKLKIGDEEREYTPEQLAGMVSRYSDLNITNAQRKQMEKRLGPALQIIEELTGKLPEDDADAGKKVASFITQAIKGQTSNKRGNDAKGEAGEEGAGEEGFDWDKWAEDNDVSVPPAFKQMTERQGAIEGMLAQILQNQGKLNQAMGDQAGAVSEAQDQVNNDKIAVAKRMVMTNLDNLQREFELSDDELDPFLDHIASQGVMMEELVDMDFARQMGQSFANAKKAGNFDRVEQALTRRQAFAGSLAAQPGDGAAAPAPNASQPGGQTLNRLVDKHMNRLG